MFILRSQRRRKRRGGKGGGGGEGEIVEEGKCKVTKQRNIKDKNRNDKIKIKQNQYSKNCSLIQLNNLINSKKGQWRKIKREDKTYQRRKWR